MDRNLRDRKRSFRNFSELMPLTVLHSPGPHKSIAPNSDSKISSRNSNGNTLFEADFDFCPHGKACSRSNLESEFGAIGS